MYMGSNKIVLGGTQSQALSVGSDWGTPTPGKGPSCIGLCEHITTTLISTKSETDSN